MPTLQDAAVKHFRVKLSHVLTLMRILAGRRGHSTIAFHGQGFLYTLTAVREPRAAGTPATIDDDRSEEGMFGADNAALRARLAERLEVHP